MERLLKVGGASLIIIGVVVLVVLVTNLSDYVHNFPSNPIHDYIVGDNEPKTLLIIGDEKVVVSETTLRFVALFLGFLFLRIWVDIGFVFVKTGRVLLTNDIEKIDLLVKKLSNKNS